VNNIYDTIGVNYSHLRMPDPRIATAIANAIGSAETVLNVGAGAGSYEPADRQVTAVEPSLEMIRQRGPSAAKVIRGYAEDLIAHAGKEPSIDPSAHAVVHLRTEFAPGATVPIGWVAACPVRDGP